MYALVVLLIQLSATTGNIEIKASNVGIFEDMITCFQARETFPSAVFGTAPGYYPPNTQGICIPAIPVNDTES